MMGLTTPSERESQVGCLRVRLPSNRLGESQVGCLRVRLPSNRLGLFNPDHVLLLFVLLSFDDRL